MNERGPLAMLSYALCAMLSVEWLPLAMLSFEWLPLAMLSFEF